MYSNPQIDWRDNFASFSMPPGTITISVTPIRIIMYGLYPGFTITSGSGTSTITVSINTGAAVGNGQNVTVQALILVVIIIQKLMINGGFNGVTCLLHQFVPWFNFSSWNFNGNAASELGLLKWRFFKYCYSEQINFSKCLQLIHQ
jgi:hypothetical protein